MSAAKKRKVEIELQYGLRAKRQAFHVIGDYAVTPNALGAGFVVTQISSGRCFNGVHEQLDVAKRYADAFAVVLADRDPRTVTEGLEAQLLRERVRDLAERV